MSINIIVAIGKNNEIGCNNCLLVHIPEDLKYFKEVTKGHIVIMGRKTLESLPNGKPLKNRDNIVISRQEVETDGIYLADSVENSIDIAREIQQDNKEKEIFIIGGESIYRQFLPIADKLYITHMFEEFEADTYFPSIKEDWKLESMTGDVCNINCFIPHVFAIYERK